MKIKCTCKHEFQDQQHGPGIRVATPVNKTVQGGKLTECRCTVCGTKHFVRKEELNKKLTV